MLKGNPLVTGKKKHILNNIPNNVFSYRKEGKNPLCFHFVLSRLLDTMNDQGRHSLKSETVHLEVHTPIHMNIAEGP